MAVMNSTIEKKLWDAADSLRTNSKLKSSEYATPVLGLIFLRFADYRFSLAEKRVAKEFENSRRAPSKIDYQRQGVLFVPPTARYSYLLNLPEEEDIQQAVIQAMKDIEEENPSLKDVLPKQYRRVPKDVLISLLKAFSEIEMQEHNGDTFGAVYEYFLSKFALSEGQKGGEFFTPTSLVRLIVEILEPNKGLILDIIIPKLIQFNDFRKLLLKGVQILLRGCIMKSDHWLQLNYKHGKSIWASDIVHYYYWYDDENKPVGISLNFEYADDFHYDIAMEEWGKAARLLSINEDLNNTEECLKTFFSGHSRMFDFEEFLQSNEIKFSKIALY